MSREAQPSRSKRRFGHPWHIRLWQRCTLWAVTIDGTITWWCGDDVHHRERRVDVELRLPKRLFRPICWLTKDGHSDYYGECVVCAKPMSRKAARR